MPKNDQKVVKHTEHFSGLAGQNFTKLEVNIVTSSVQDMCVL